MKRECSNCIYFARNAESGQCKRYPPQLLHVRVPGTISNPQGGMALVAMFPSVPDVESCGEWSQGSQVVAG